MPNSQVKYLLKDSDIPTHWYNIVADLPNDVPCMINPQNKKILTPDELSLIFADKVIEQEFSKERYIKIPDEVRNILKQWRPSPLYRARRLEKALGTPARIYYKYEGVSPSGSHKTNSAIAQAYYNKKQGIKKLSTETGAGQWGSSLSLAAEIFDLECLVYMVRCSYDQKPYRKALMQLFNGKAIASPSNTTASGRAILEKDPNCSGSLGIAISEAVEVAALNSDTNYCLGSVLNHVLLHQSIIGIEAIKQMQMANDYPDIVVGCCGGGSNFAGIALPFLGEKLNKKKDIEILGIEPAACPTLTKGIYAYDYGDVASLTPLMKMYTLGSSFIPPATHSGGLRYHGMSPLVSYVMEKGFMKADTVMQTEAFDSGVLFARTECITPAPESCHAIAGAIKVAKECIKTKEEKCILFNLSGHGHFDMQAYIEYFANNLKDYEYPSEEIAMALSCLPSIK